MFLSKSTTNCCLFIKSRTLLEAKREQENHNSLLIRPSELDSSFLVCLSVYRSHCSFNQIQRRQELPIRQGTGLTRHGGGGIYRRLSYNGLTCFSINIWEPALQVRFIYDLFICWYPGGSNVQYSKLFQILYVYWYTLHLCNWDRSAMKKTDWMPCKNVDDISTGLSC